MTLTATLHGLAAVHCTSRLDRLRRLLLLAGGVFLGVAVGGIPLSLYDINGCGQMVMFGGFVAYLLLRDVRGRISEWPPHGDALKRPVRQAASAFY